MGVRVSSPGIVGRQAELRRLQAALESAVGGQAGIVLVSGEAGVGKTRLVDEFANAAGWSGAQVRVGGCVRLSGEVAPFAPLVEALRPLLHDLAPADLAAVIGPNRLGLGALLPDLAEPGEAIDATGVSFDGGQSRLFELSLGLVVRLAAHAPLVLVVEDIQWADRSTLDLIAFLARNLRSDPVLLVATLRTDEPEARIHVLPFIAELGRQPRLVRIDLDRLTRRELAEQLAGILGRTPEPLLVDRVFALSQGNAFFSEELLAAAPSAGPLPQTLRDVLVARLATLSQDAAELLRVASAAGRHFSEELLASVSDSDDRTFRSALHATLDHQVLVRETRGDGELLSFRHVLMQELAYAELLPSERRRLHAACARTLEAGLPASDPDPMLAAELAYHWQAADDSVRALPAAITAGLAAQRTGARAEAAEQFERAIALLEGLPEPPPGLPLDHVELLERAAASASGDPPRALALIDRAIALVDPAHDVLRAGQLRAARGRYLWLVGDGAGALEECRAAVDLVPSSPQSVARARVNAGLAQILNILGRSDESIPFSREAIALARATGATAIESHALNTLGSATAYLGDIDGGLELLDQALEIARSIGSWDDIGRAHQNTVDVLVFLATRFDEGIDVGLAAVERSRPDAVTGIHAAMILGHVAAALYLEGRWDEAEATLQKLQFVDAGGVGEVVRVLRTAQLDVGRGRFEAAERDVSDAGDVLADAVDAQFIAPAAQVLAELAIWQRQPVRALEAVAAGLARIRPVMGEVLQIAPLHVLGLRAAADLSQRRGRSTADDATARDHAHRHLAELRGLHDRIAAEAPVHLRLAAPYLALAEAEAGRLAREVDASPWGRAAELLERVPLPYVAAYARYREAEALFAGRRGLVQARQSLRRAHVAAMAIGAVPLQAAIDHLATRAKVDVSGDDDDRRQASRPAGLSQREQQILALVADGRTNREIGQELFITEKTASHHVSNILAKLDVADRGAAAAKAARLGIAPPAE